MEAMNGSPVNKNVRAQANPEKGEVKYVVSYDTGLENRSDLSMEARSSASCNT